MSLVVGVSAFSGAVVPAQAARPVPVKEQLRLLKHRNKQLQDQNARLIGTIQRANDRFAGETSSATLNENLLEASELLSDRPGPLLPALRDLAAHDAQASRTVSAQHAQILTLSTTADIAQAGLRDSTGTVGVLQQQLLGASQTARNATLEARQLQSTVADRDRQLADVAGRLGGAGTVADRLAAVEDALGGSGDLLGRVETVRARLGVPAGTSVLGGVSDVLAGLDASAVGH